MTNPCYPNSHDCPYRRTGCHATCPEGIAADKERRALSERIHAEKQAQQAAMSVIMYGVRRTSRAKYKTYEGGPT